MVALRHWVILRKTDIDCTEKAQIDSPKDYGFKSMTTVTS